MRMSPCRPAFAVALSLGLLSHADATPILKLTSGSSEVVVTDADGDGAVVFNGSLGTWFLNVATGVSKPALGSADEPELDLNSVNLSSAAGAASSVNIWLTDTGFNAKSSLVDLVAAIGGTTSGTVSYRTFYDASNAEFGTANELTSTGPLSGLAFSTTLTSALSSLTQYSLTLLVTITHGPSTTARSTSFNAIVKVPEPSTLLLLGGGLLAIVYLLRRKSAGRRVR